MKLYYLLSKVLLKTQQLLDLPSRTHRQGWRAGRRRSTPGASSLTSPSRTGCGSSAALGSSSPGATRSFYPVIGYHRDRHFLEIYMLMLLSFLSFLSFLSQ